MQKFKDLVKNTTVPSGVLPDALPGARGVLDVDKIKLVKIFLSRLTDLGETLTHTNPTALTKPKLRNLANIIYVIGDVMVNKKIVGKINPNIDEITHGLDLIGVASKFQPKVKRVPVSDVVPNIFREVDAIPNPTEKPIIYNNPELIRQISILKNDRIFRNLSQRLRVLMASKPSNKRGLSSIRVFLNTVYNAMEKNSVVFQQKIGNPTVVKKELISDKEYLKEITTAQIVEFGTELNKALIDIIAVASSIRLAFSRKNPNSIYNIKGSGVANQINEMFRVGDYKKFFI